MRKSLAGVWTVAALVAACGGFGSEDEQQQQQQQPPPSTPQDNSVPPVAGKPVDGIFVSSSKGKAGASGFLGTPLNSIRDGLARAKETKLRLIVCAEEYNEAVEWIDGVSAYGYFDCSGPTFVQVEGRRAVVKSPTSPALFVHDITTPTRIEGFEIVAPDLAAGTEADPSGTSVGAEIRRVAPNTLAIGQSTIRGGHGAPGANGDPPFPVTVDGELNGTPGIDQSSSNCTPQMIACANLAVPGVPGPKPTCGTETPGGPGGDGGDGMWFIECAQHPQSNNNQAGRPIGSANATTAAGGAPCGPDNNLPGCGRGYDGAQGTAGSDGATAPWTLGADGRFVGGAGTRGKTGSPGLGGGGGGGALYWFYGGNLYYNPPCGGTNYFRTSRGGSGGAGGCGGIAGGGGAGGGASIGLLAIEAAVVLEKVRVESSEGGQGGAGTFGGDGYQGGQGAAGGTGAGRGGNGGRGGVGGSSANGASGPSIALAFFGARPVKGPGTELKPGPGGLARDQVTKASTGKVIAATPAGESLPEFEIK